MIKLRDRGDFDSAEFGAWYGTVCLGIAFQFACIRRMEYEHCVGFYEGLSIKWHSP